jgi:hypothetical protein
LEADGQHKVELLFTPMINQDMHAVFLTQTAESDTSALHVLVMKQTGVHMNPKTVFKKVVLSGEVNAQ